jgi:hypothetical protein
MLYPAELRGQISPFYWRLPARIAAFFLGPPAVALRAMARHLAV